MKNDSNRENIILGTKKITSGLQIGKMNVTFGEHPLSVSPFLLKLIMQKSYWSLKKVEVVVWECILAVSERNEHSL
jgi:hypothetical protein